MYFFFLFYMLFLIKTIKRKKNVCFFLPSFIFLHNQPKAHLLTVPSRMMRRQ